MCIYIYIYTYIYMYTYTITYNHIQLHTSIYVTDLSFFVWDLLGQTRRGNPEACEPACCAASSMNSCV